MSKSIKTITRKLLDLFGTDGKHWTTGALARDRHGHHAVVEDVNKRDGSFCLMGGLEKTGQLNGNNHSLLIRAVEDFTEGNDLTVEGFNDSHRWPTVKKFLMKYAHPYQPKKAK